MAKITTATGSDADLTLEPDGTGDINLTPGTNGDVNIPANKGITFGAAGEKIEGNATKLDIAAAEIDFSIEGSGDINIPANIGLTFASDTEKIESNDTDLTVNSGGAINLTATTDVVIPADVGVTFGTGEKIEGNDTDLTLTSGGDIDLTATNDVVIPVNVGLVLGDGGEKIESDNTDLTVTSGGDIILDADGADITLKDGGTTYGFLKQASGHLVIQPTSSKEIILNHEGGSAALTVETDGDVTIKGDTFDAAYADWSSSSTILGWSSLTAGRRQLYYKKMGTIVSVCCHLEGTSNATTVSFTLPYNFITTDYMSFMSNSVWCYDNGSADSGPGYVELDSNTNICEVYRGSGAWTASGTKIIRVSFTYATPS